MADEQATLRNVSATEAHQILTENKAVVLDIRTPEEFSEAHIEGAINVDFQNRSFEDELNKLDKNASYVLHCRIGGRSTAALPTLHKLGFKNILHLDKGIMDWQAEQLPTEQ